MRPDHARSPFAALPVAVIGSLLGAALLAVAPRYGYHRDELYFREAGRHLAWGYIDQPPLTPLIARVGVALFGDSPLGLRVLPALIAVCTVVVAGVLARELCSGRGGQVLAAASTAVTAMVLQSGHVVSTPTVDILLWLVIATIVARMLADDQPLWFVAIGVAVGVAMLNKYTVVVLVAALGVGLVAVGPRSVLRSRWVVVGALIAIVMVAPNLLWQLRNELPVFSVASGIGGDDGVENRVLFVPMQLLVVGPPLVPICIAGALRLWRDPAVRFARCLVLAYPVAAVVLLIVGGKFYYSFGLLAVLLIAGAQPTVDWARTRLRSGVVIAAVVVTGVVDAVLMLPVLPADSIGVVNAVNKEQGEQIGWPALVDAVQKVSEQVPQRHRATATIVTANYGEAGAVDRFGPALDLPQAYSGHMSFYSWGPPPDSATGPVVLVTGDDTHELTQVFDGCHVVATVDNGLGVDNEEQGARVWLCDPPPQRWSELWPRLRRYS